MIKNAHIQNHIEHRVKEHRECFLRWSIEFQSHTSACTFIYLISLSQGITTRVSIFTAGNDTLASGLIYSAQNVVEDNISDYLEQLSGTPEQ